jgi:hypothetical protein
MPEQQKKKGQMDDAKAFISGGFGGISNVLAGVSFICDQL